MRLTRIVCIRLFMCILLLFMFFAQINAQKVDTIPVGIGKEDAEEVDILEDRPISKGKYKSVYPALIISSVCITYGAIAHNNRLLKGLDQDTHGEVQRHFDKEMRIDDYLQFAPAVSAYGLNFIGVKGESNLRDLTTVMLTSYLLSTSSVQIVKSCASRWRPDHSSNNSFPSGHTATAFVGAHILCKEYYKTKPIIAIGGYLVATTTGVFRVLNRRHWVSDIIAGAGVGILCVEVSYLLLPVINKVLWGGKANNNLSIAPSLMPNNYGLAMAYRF